MWSGGDSGNVLSVRVTESRGKASGLLSNELSSRWREDVDDVERLSDGEILITDEVYGRESRVDDFAFEETKGESRFGGEG